MNAPASYISPVAAHITLLADHQLFHAVATEVIEECAKTAHLRTEPKGKVLFMQEDAADWVYVIASGWVKVFRETLEGCEAVIDVLNSGHIFGENAIFEDNVYSYSAEVVEEAQLLMIPVSSLQKAIEKEQSIALNMLTFMSLQRRQKNREIEHLNMQNASQRIGCFLLRLCSATPPQSVTLNLPYDKTLIASRLGMKPETFSRALARLKSEAKLEIRGASVTIPDIPFLIDYTCSHCSESFPCDDLK